MFYAVLETVNKETDRTLVQFRNKGPRHLRIYQPIFEGRFFQN